MRRFQTPRGTSLRDRPMPVKKSMSVAGGVDRQTYAHQPLHPSASIDARCRSGRYVLRHARRLVRRSTSSGSIRWPAPCMSVVWQRLPCRWQGSMSFSDRRQLHRQHAPPPPLAREWRPWRGLNGQRWDTVGCMGSSITNRYVLCCSLSLPRKAYLDAWTRHAGISACSTSSSLMMLWNRNHFTSRRSPHNRVCDSCEGRV
jgi:hypothetical protein